jgi:hypothetical protein
LPGWPGKPHHVEMLSGRRKRDYAADSAAEGLPAEQAEEDVVAIA